MQRIQTALISLTISLSLSPLAFSADPGTYRPGQPYAATPAATHSLCQAQCQGDAACRGWNFVRANPRQKTGICEFNSRAVSPIQSPISVSANQNEIINSTGQSRIIPAGIRTTRIGAPQAARAPQPVKPTAKTVQPRPAHAAQGRRVIRQQAPAQVTPQASAYRHNLGATPQRIPPQITRRLALPPQSPLNVTRTTNGFPPPAPRGFAAPQRPITAPNRAQPDPRLQQPLTQRHPAAHPNQIAANPAAPQARTPQRGGLIRALTQQDAGAAHTTAPQQRPQTTAPLSYEEASQQSLYGHLNDDVARPKVLKAEDFNIPNDQPIPTVQSVPVKPVNREAFSGLAGG